MKALAAIAVAIASTGSGASAFQPLLLVRGDGRASFQVVLPRLTSQAGETARVEVYVPRGWNLDTNLPAGTRIGSVLIFASLQFSGYVEVVDPAAHPGSECAQAPHAALWRLVKSDNVGPFDEAFVAVDMLGSEPAGRFAAYRLTVCLPATPGGSKPNLIQFQIDGAIRAPTGRGEWLWRAVFTPRSGQAVESRSLVRLPVRVSLSASRYVRTIGRRRVASVLVSGRVTEAAQPPAGGYGLELARATAPAGQFVYLGVLRPDASGRFRTSVRDRGGRFYRVRTTHSAVTAGRRAPRGLCGGTSIAAGGCVSANLWEFYVPSAVVRAR